MRETILTFGANDMTLANRKEFHEAGFKRMDTGISIVWSKDLNANSDDFDCVIIHSEVRGELDDQRPEDDWEPCNYYHFNGINIVDQGSADTPLAAIKAASQIQSLQ